MYLCTTKVQLNFGSHLNAERIRTEFALAEVLYAYQVLLFCLN